MKVTYSDLQNSRIPAVIGACIDDPRLLAITNECLERLMYEGHWHNTTQRVRFCATDGCITQPPQVATIERVAVCGQPIPIRTIWFEWMEGGSGLRGQRNNSSPPSEPCGSNGFSCGPNEAIFRGYFPTFADINPTNKNKKVNLTCDLASDVGKAVLLLGYNSEGIWIRTEQDGVISDGEVVLLAQGAGTTSNNFFSVLTDVQFNEDRDSIVWAYEFNTDTSLRRMIGTFQAFETRPNYARYFFPGIKSRSNIDESGCAQVLVDAVVKLNFWPVRSPNDYLCVPCLPAIKELAQGVNSAEHEPDSVKKVQIIATAMASAKSVLNAQLQHFTGDGIVPSMTVIGIDTPPVPSLL